MVCPFQFIKTLDLYVFQTMVVSQNMVACRLEKHFPDPLEFKPDRWVADNRKGIHPYLVLPFGHGMRSCIARRMAEQNMLLFMLRVT